MYGLCYGDSGGVIIMLYAKVGSTKTLFMQWTGYSALPQSGLSPLIRIKRLSDGKFLKSDLTWSTTPADPTMTEIDATNFPGFYKFDLALLSTTDTYVISYDGTTSVPSNVRFKWDQLTGIEFSTLDINKAKAVLVNKQKQTTSTGIVIVRDDSDTNDLITFTPTVTTTERIITPS